jgi:hypothetical protein
VTKLSPRGKRTVTWLHYNKYYDYNESMIKDKRESTSIEKEEEKLYE